MKINRKYRIIRFFIVLLLLFSPVYSYSKTITPLEFGLDKATSNEERFWVLYKTHSIANENSWKVSYKGINQINIDIPADAKSIPLSDCTDFKNVSIIVNNTQRKNFFLFELVQETYPVSVPKELFETYDFRRIEQLKKGKKLLIIEDLNAWVENREGYNYGAIRRDVLFLNKGKSINKTIAPYSNAASAPKCSYVSISRRRKEFKNINFIRTIESTFKTFLVRVMSMDNVLIQDISIMTPKPISMDGDRAIAVENCTNVVFKNITINQTYSYDNHYGYGILMNNVWNSQFNNIVGNAAWGIFGNNNINTVNVSNSLINRFDTHCYGRDFHFRNCEFTEYGLTQSSFFGVLEFNECTFSSAIVCFFRTDYNAFTPFTIILKDCTIYLDKGHNYLVRVGNISNEPNKRQELQEKHTPDVYLYNTTVVLDDEVVNWSLFHLKSKSSQKPFNNIGAIRIDGLNVKGSHADLSVFDRLITYDKPIDVNFSGMSTKHPVLNIQSQR